MLFSSTIFLYLFLPFTLLGYYLIHDYLRNYWLLAASLIFFAWGGVAFTFILLCSIILNYGFGLLIDQTRESKARYGWLFAGVSVNLGILGVYKYANFIIANINGLAGLLTIPLIPQTSIILPIGISFYTFHSLSYLVDIYRGKVSAQRNILDLSLYICMFSQLIAGPIIRYSDVWQQLKGRTHSMAQFSSGVERFLIGLGKKVLLANTFARVADNIFGAELLNLHAPSAWLGIVCYSLQIYCDFAGYSDMAIGLGRMFGFDFQENFNFPYMARSVKEFWRRWHISLSTFFRDYVYIPLGGSHKGVRRTYVNLVLVFFLTGFWHGASWAFVVWGLMHGLFMVIERLGFERILEKAWRPLPQLYTLLVVMFAWVLFRADTLSHALGYWEVMFKFKPSNGRSALLMAQLEPQLAVAFAVAIPGIFGVYARIQTALERWFASPRPVATVFAYGYHLASTVAYAAILILCTLYLVAGSYNPFIYYRF